MREPLVSVVIPTQNRRTLLERTLTCVLTQRFGLHGVDAPDRGLEVVVVDEASEDDTRRFLDDVRSRDPRVRVIRHDVPRGVACARNAGLQAARGRWVAFCDDDDLWAPGKLAAQLRALRMAPQARWSAVGSVIIDSRLRVLVAEVVPREAVATGGGDVSRPLLYSNAIPGGGSGVLADAELVRALDGFDPALRNLADWDLWIRLGQASPLAAVDAPLLAYRWHRGGMSRALDDIEAELSYIDDKYGRTRLDMAIPMGWETMYRWVAMMHLLGRNRRAAATAYLKAARARMRTRRASGARATGFPVVHTAVSLAAVVWPGLHGVRRAQFLRRAPVGWVAGARAWLDEVAGIGTAVEGSSTAEAHEPDRATA